MVQYDYGPEDFFGIVPLSFLLWRASPLLILLFTLPFVSLLLNFIFTRSISKIISGIG